MSLFATLHRFAADYRERRRRLRTYLEIASLAPEIQKDIGWRQHPQSYEPLRRHRGH
jgi:hypothetical protein